MTWKRTIDPVSGDAMGFGFATFATERAILRALRLLDGFAIPDAEALVVKVDTKVRPTLERVAAAGMSEQMMRSELARDAVVLKKLQQLAANYAKRRKRRRVTSSISTASAVPSDAATAPTPESATNGKPSDASAHVDDQAVSAATGASRDAIDNTSADAPVVSATESSVGDEATTDAPMDGSVVADNHEDAHAGETPATVMPLEREQPDDSRGQRALHETEPPTRAELQDAAAAAHTDNANDTQPTDRDALGRDVRTRHDDSRGRDRSSKRSRDRSRARDDRTRQRTREHERSRKRRDRSRSYERASRRHRSHRHRSASRSHSRSRLDHRHHHRRDRESERRSRRRRYRDESSSSSSSDNDHSDDNEQQQSRRTKRPRRESTVSTDSRGDDDRRRPDASATARVEDAPIDTVPPVESPPKVVPKIVLGLKSASAKRDKPVATMYVSLSSRADGGAGPSDLRTLQRVTD